MEELLVSKYPDESGISDTCALLILRGEATAERDDQKKIRGQITLVHFDMQTHAHTYIPLILVLHYNLNFLFTPAPSDSL